jgi:hypothetical protein
MININEVAKILGCTETSVKNYISVWGELYDLWNTTPKEFAEMISDIIVFY